VTERNDTQHMSSHVLKEQASTEQAIAKKKQLPPSST